jgi:SAM-dependent methyltransferase
MTTKSSEREVLKVFGHLDTPTIKTVRLGEINTFSGWVFLSDGSDVTAVEVLYGDEVLGSCRYGFQRDDVFRDYPDWEQAKHSGFVGEVYVPKEPLMPLSVVVRDKRGRQHKAFEFDARPALFSGQTIKGKIDKFTPLELARALQKCCAKVNFERIRALWTQAQEAEKAFWLGLSPERLQKSQRAWKEFAEFLYEATRLYTSLGPESAILQVGTALQDAIHYFPVGRRYSVDPLTDFFKQNFPWAYDPSYQLTAITAPGESLPFENSTFALVILNNMLDHVYEPVMVLQEACRVLPDDGVLFVGVNVFPAELCRRRRAIITDDPCHPYVFSQGDVLQLLRWSGFHPLALKLSPSSDPGIPEQKYMAVFSLKQAPKKELPLPPGEGWVRLSLEV